MDLGFLRRTGTRTRHPVDFYPERCAWCYGLYAGPSLTANGFVELFNNDPLGRMLRIYFFNTGGVANSGSYLCVVKGPVGSNPPAEVGSTLVGGISPLVPGFGGLPGQLLGGNQPAGSSAVQPAFPLLVFAGFSLATAISPAPLAIVPAGYSALAFEWQGQDFAEASMLYMLD